MSTRDYKRLYLDLADRVGQWQQAFNQTKATAAQPSQWDRVDDAAMSAIERLFEVQLEQVTEPVVPLRRLPPLPPLPVLSDGWDGQPELMARLLKTAAHQELHDAFDRLLAGFVANGGRLSASVQELMVWSANRLTEPPKPPDDIDNRGEGPHGA